jgi:hypothetical protein
LAFEVADFADAFDLLVELPIAVDFVLDDGVVDDVVDGPPSECEYALKRPPGEDVLDGRAGGANAGIAVKAEAGEIAHDWRIIGEAVSGKIRGENAKCKMQNAKVKMRSGRKGSPAELTSRLSF